MGLLDIFKVSKIKAENEQLKQLIQEMQNKMDSTGITDYLQLKEKITKEQSDFDAYIKDREKQLDADIQSTQEQIRTLLEQREAELKSINAKIQAQLDSGNKEISEKNAIIARLHEEISTLNQQDEKLTKQVATQARKLSRSKELYSSVEYAINNFFESDVSLSECKLNRMDFDEYELLSPTVILKLHCMDVKDLRKVFRENEKQIDRLLTQYASRYTTKANKTIYSLMVIALRAELQNVLYNLKYEKLDKSIDDIKKVSAKYLKIAGEGNQSIAGTLTKFIGEIEYLFINAVKIEYNYYVKKEQAKQEQLAIKEQMRQEAEERKALEAEKKKVEKEESKFNVEITKLQEQLQVSSKEDMDKLQKRILELQAQLANVVVKKSEIAKLQNGKAGNVYVISNLGSFGENVFKVGMTRRMNPQDRVNELGDASVPFKFDVHSFIFSDNAVDLENKLHEILHEKRVNKVNLRKEFFYTSVEELEKIVTEIEPTAEFNKTMLAEEFRQSQSSDSVYSSDYVYDIDSDEE